MKNVLLILAFSFVSLHAGLTFDSSTKHEIRVLASLDIDPNFIYDKTLITIEQQYKKKYKDAHFFRAMKDAYIFIPKVKELITAADVPEAILYLAMAESNFKTRAYSSKKASGMWQFMPYTAKLFDLKIDDYVDERRDLIKSTQAAISYLKQSQRRFGKWYLAALSYNCGMGRVNKAIQRAGTDDLRVLLDPKKKYLPRESRRYIRKIIALALMAHDEDFMLKTEFEYLMNRGNAHSLATVRLQSGERLSRVAQVLDMELGELKKLNRHLRYDFIPPNTNGYDIYIPYVKLAQFKEDYQPTDLDQVYVVHVVKKGENLAIIGKKYHLPYKVIKDFNQLKNSFLSLNQKLIIPVDKKNKVHSRAYLVQKGDTLTTIAEKHNIKLHRLRELNSLTSNTIHVGDRLVILD